METLNMEAKKILSANFLDILFEGRNKEYGAYDLRKSYPKRLTAAIIVAASFAGILLLMSFTLPGINGKGKKERIEDHELANAKNDVPLLPPPPPPPPPPPKIEVKKIQLDKFTVPDFVPKDEVKDEDKVKDPDEIINVSDKTQDGIKVEVPTPYIGGEDKGKVIETPAPETKKDEDFIYTKVEIDARFQGSFRDFLERNLRFPEDAKEAGQSGVVIVEFVVDREGKISQPHVADNSPVKISSLVEEAIRIIKKSSGKWSAGIQNGSAVPSYHQQAINFLLAEDEG